MLKTLIFELMTFEKVYGVTLLHNVFFSSHMLKLMMEKIHRNNVIILIPMFDVVTLTHTLKTFIANIIFWYIPTNISINKIKERVTSNK